MPYSAVTQPLPVLRKNGGTRSSTLAAHTTFVRPTSMSTDPSACARKPGVMRVGRSWVEERPSVRVMRYPFEALGERMAEVDVSGERVGLLAVNQDLHARHRRQVHGEGVHDGVHGEQLVECAAGMLLADVGREVDERVAAIGDEHVAQLRFAGHRRDERRRRLDLRLDDRARLLGDTRAERYFPL